MKDLFSTHAIQKLLLGLMLSLWCSTVLAATPTVTAAKTDRKNERTTGASPLHFERPVIPIDDMAELSFKQAIHAYSHLLFRTAAEKFHIYAESVKGQEPVYSSALLYECQSHLENKNPQAVLARLQNLDDKILNQSPRKEELIYTKARAMYETGDYAGALSTVNPLYVPNGKLAQQALLLSADSAAQLQHWGQAKSMLERYLAQNRKKLTEAENNECQFRLIEIMLNLAAEEKNEAAGKICEEIEKRLGDMKDRGQQYLLLQLRLLVMRKNLKAADDLYQKELEKEMGARPSKGWELALTSYANGLLQAGRQTEALTIYTQALRRAVSPMVRIRLLQQILDLEIRQNLLASAKTTLNELIHSEDFSLQTVELTLALATKLHAQREESAAAEYCQMAVELPQSTASLRFQAMMLQGDAYFSAGDYARAKDSFEIAGQYSLDDEEILQANIRKAKTFIHLYQLKKEPKYLEEASQIYEKSSIDFVELPEGPITLFELGKILAQQEKFREAARYYQKFIEKAAPHAKELGEARLQYLLCLSRELPAIKKREERTAQLQGIINGLEKFIQDYPDGELQDRAISFVYQLAYGEGMVQLAQAPLAKVASSSPNFSKAHFLRILLFLSTNDRMQIQQAQQLAESFFQGLAKEKSTKISDEAAVCNDALRLHIADSYANEQNWKKALEHYKAAADAPRDADTNRYARYETAYAALQCGDIETARARLESLTRFLESKKETSPLLARAYFLLGEIYSRSIHTGESSSSAENKTTSDQAKALTCYEKAAKQAKEEKNNQDREIGFAAQGRAGQLALLLGRQDGKQLSKAKALFSELLQQLPKAHPMTITAQYHLAQCLVQEGKEDEAIKILTEIFCTWEAQKSKNAVRPQGYLLKCCLTLIELLEKKEDELSLKQARHFQMLIQQNHPQTGGK